MRLMAQLKPASHALLILAGVILFTPGRRCERRERGREALIGKYCAGCHNPTTMLAGSIWKGPLPPASPNGRKSVRK